jgi:hypothetical protein
MREFVVMIIGLIILQLIFINFYYIEKVSYIKFYYIMIITTTYDEKD